MDLIKSLRQVTALVLMLGLTSLAHGQVIPIDDFNDGNADGWTPIDTTIGEDFGPGTYDASSGEYLLQGGGPVPTDVPTDGVLFSQWDMSSDPQFLNGYVRFKTRVNEKNTSSFVVMRADVPTFSGHIFGVNTELDNFRFLIQTLVNGESTLAILETGPIYEPNQDWMFEAGAIGDQLSLKWWQPGEKEPVSPQIVATEGSLSSGSLLVGASSPGDHNPPSLVSASFDDLSFVVPEPSSLSLVLAGFALIGLGAVRR